MSGWAPPHSSFYGTKWCCASAKARSEKRSDALVMLLASPAMQYATSKHIFGIKTISRPEKDLSRNSRSFC